MLPLLTLSCKYPVLFFFKASWFLASQLFLLLSSFSSFSPNLSTSFVSYILSILIDPPPILHPIYSPSFHPFPLLPIYPFFPSSIFSILTNPPIILHPIQIHSPSIFFLFVFHTSSFFSTFYPIHPYLYTYLRLIIFILNHQPSIHSLNLSIPTYHPPFPPPDLSTPTHITTFDTLTLPLLFIILPFSPCTTQPYPSTSLPPPSLSPLFTPLLSTLHPFQPLPSYLSSTPCPFQTIHLPPCRGLV